MSNKKVTEFNAFTKIVPEDIVHAVTDISGVPINNKGGFGVFLKTYNRSASEIAFGLSNDDLDFKEDEGNVIRYGADLTGAANSTSAFQTTIDVSWNSHVNAFYPAFVPAGVYSVTQLIMKTHVRILGEGAGVIHSNVVTDQFQSEILQPAGTNLDLFLYNSVGEDTNSFFHDCGVENISLRGKWTGIGDVISTAGSAIKFDGVTPGQNMYWRVSIRDWPEHGVELTRHSLPGTFNNIHARELGGDVIHCETVSGRNAQMFFCDNIHGDFIVGSIISIDDSALTNSVPNTYLFSNIKHEVNTGYGTDTIVLNDVDRGAVTVINASALENGETHNAIVRITGSKAPHLTLIGCRAGTGGKLIDDDVNSQDLTGVHRYAEWFAAGFKNIVANNNADIIEQTRMRSDASGVTDAEARYQRGAQGKMEWGDGTAALDVTLFRNGANNLKTEDTFDALDYKLSGKIIRTASEVVITTNVITAAENGNTFFLDLVGGFTSTLPAPSIDLKYTFIVTTAPTTSYIITTNSGDNVLFGTFLDIVGELVYFSAQDTLNFVLNVSLVGDRLEVESDGTNWYCKAFSGADGGITVSVT